ncbi:MAG: LPP20 family lipoprotein [Candidatus Cloacimonadota bacterium]|nr:LPP20 family lipoprotein [Candidatus Cloacimonadota bacterium]
MMQKKLVLMAMVIFIISCSAPKKPMQIPDWVYHPYKDYSKNLFINAVGTGNAKSAAETDAYNNISKAIQKDVTTRESVKQKYQEKIGARFTSDETMAKQTLFEKERSLRGIEFEKTYFDEKDGVYFVLACLDRIKTGKIYNEEIEKNNIRIQNIYSQYNGTLNKMEKLKYLQKAINLADLTEELNEQYRVISILDHGVDLKISKNELVSEQMRFTNNISVSIKAAGKWQKQLVKYLSETFNAIGFNVDPYQNSSLIDFNIAAELTIARANGKRKDLKFISWNLNITVLAKQYGNSELEFTRSGREGHINETEAVNRSLREVFNVISHEFYDYFINNF